MLDSRPKEENCRLVLTLLKERRRVKVKDARNVIEFRGRHYLVEARFHEGHSCPKEYIEGLLNYASEIHAVPRRIMVDYAPEPGAFGNSEISSRGQIELSESSGASVPPEDDIPF